MASKIQKEILQLIEELIPNKENFFEWVAYVVEMIHPECDFDYPTNKEFLIALREIKQVQDKYFKDVQ